jgi:hypothetical protein
LPDDDELLENIQEINVDDTDDDVIELFDELITLLDDLELKQVLDEIIIDVAIM